jgi:hypothetical protein
VRQPLSRPVTTRKKHANDVGTLAVGHVVTGYGLATMLGHTSCSLTSALKNAHQKTCFRKPPDTDAASALHRRGAGVRRDFPPLVARGPGRGFLCRAEVCRGRDSAFPRGPNPKWPRL